MVFGPLIDVPLIVGGFILMLVLRKRIASALGKLRAPTFLIFLLISVPLIIVEEDIDCGASWCGQVIIPPTLPVLFVEILILGALAIKLRARSVFRVVLSYCVFGVGWELTVGGLRGASLLVDLILIPYVAIGYAYISLLPVEVLLAPPSG